MKLQISQRILNDLHAHLEEAYPGEGAGFLLGEANGDPRVVSAIFKLPNARDEADQHNRYLLTAQDMLLSEKEAARLGLDIIGVFHSHPDCPNVPSEFDREWAMPWFSYIISRVDVGVAVNARSWRLADDRETFEEETIQINS